LTSIIADMSAQIEELTEHKQELVNGTADAAEPTATAADGDVEQEQPVMRKCIYDNLFVAE
jgi:hypothetical protein